jgi:8-oxo-dGTP diphosphatase
MTNDGVCFNGQVARDHDLRRLTAEQVLRLPQFGWASRVTVGAVVSSPSGGEILVLRRREDQEYGGIEELPSGRTQVGETIAAAIAREVFEETRLRVTSIGELSFVFGYESSKGQAVQLNFWVGVEQVTVIVLDADEHHSYRWLPWSALDSSNLTPNVVEGLRCRQGRGAEE